MSPIESLIYFSIKLLSLFIPNIYSSFNLHNDFKITNPIEKISHFSLFRDSDV